MSFQGVGFSPEMRKLVVNVKHFFDQHRKDPKRADESSTALASAALGIGECTVKMIMASFNSEGDQGLSKSQIANRGRPSFAIRPGLESIVRQFVRDANKKGKQVTVDLITKHIAATNNKDFQITQHNIHYQTLCERLWSVRPLGRNRGFYPIDKSLSTGATKSCTC
jgi:hypothetical protein